MPDKDIDKHGLGRTPEPVRTAPAHTNEPQAATNPDDRNEPQAARTETDDKNVGANDMALGVSGYGTQRREIGGGSITEELRPDPPESDTSKDPMRWHRRWMASRLAKDAGHIIGRTPEQVGLWGKGDTYRGSGILVNIDSLAKVRVYDGFKFEGDQVFASVRDLPPALVDGDVAENLTAKD